MAPGCPALVGGLVPCCPVSVAALHMATFHQLLFVLMVSRLLLLYPGVC